MMLGSALGLLDFDFFLDINLDLLLGFFLDEEGAFGQEEVDGDGILYTQQVASC